MTDPPPKWRRCLGILLLVILVAGLAASAYFLNKAALGPIWALAVGAVIGLMAGGLLARTEFRIPRTGWRKNVSFFIFYFVILSSEKWIVWISHGRDSFAFYMAYILAVMTGGLIGMVLFGWSLFSRPKPLLS